MRGNLYDLLNACVKCGTCLPECPVYRTVRDETLAPRGKISLLSFMLEGKALPEDIKDILGYCSLCGSCEAICPNGISFIDIMLEARREWKKDLLKKRVLDLLAKHHFFNAHLVIALLAKLKPETLPFRFRGKSFLNRAQQFYPSRGERKAFFFLGCLTNLFFHNVAESVIKILLKAGYDVYLPKGQVCCGFPYLSIGYKEDFEKMKSLNLSLIEKINPDLIITPCPTGAFTFRKFYLLSNAMEVTEFIAREGLMDQAKNLGLKTTWHDPCHLRNELKVKKEARKILRGISYFEEMEGAELCCGFGGSFFLSHPSLSLKIKEEKLRGIRSSPAEALVTACPGCIIFLSMGTGKKVMHLAELMERALE